MQAANVAHSGAAARRPVERVADSRWGDRLMRIGLGARGVVFLLFAYLVARVALGALGRASTSHPASLTGVPQTLASHTGGQVALFGLGVGLVFYAAFSLLDAVLHHDDESPAAKRWGDRGLSLFGFAMYSVFSVYCFMTALSASSGRQTSGKDQQQKARWSAKVLEWPGGPIWLGLLGAVLLVMFGFLVSRAIRRSFRPRLRDDRMSTRTWRIAMVLGTAGYLGRAALFGIVGGCILTAAIENDPRNGQGVDGSLRILAASTVGAPLLGLVALLLLAYGLYMFIEMRFRRV